MLSADREVCGGGRPQLRVRPYVASDQSRWDAFVSRCPAASFFHRAGWVRVITEGLGHRCHYLVAERGAEIEGVLPLAEVKSLLFGHGLISSPCCVYGGAATLSGEAAQALTDESVRLAQRLKVDALEIRNREAVRPDWPTKDLYVTFRRRIDLGEDENLNAIPRKQRAMVRKGLSAGLTSCQSPDVGRFFRIYSESVRNLGTPVFPRRFFEVLVDEFRAETEISIITAAGRDVAGVLSFYFRGEVLPYYGGSRPAARAMKANDFMYWDLLRRAAARGVQTFDFGRSKVASGSYDFKRNWGFVPEPLYYEYHLVKARALPEHNPNNPRYRWFIAAWKRLPLPVANVVGPFFSRNLG